MILMAGDLFRALCAANVPDDLARAAAEEAAALAHLPQRLDSPDGLPARPNSAHYLLNAIGHRLNYVDQQLASIDDKLIKLQIGLSRLHDDARLFRWILGTVAFMQILIFFLLLDGAIQGKRLIVPEAKP